MKDIKEKLGQLAERVDYTETSDAGGALELLKELVMVCQDIVYEIGSLQEQMARIDSGDPKYQTVNVPLYKMAKFGGKPTTDTYETDRENT